MALLFSAVTVVSDNEEAKFLVSGVPKNRDDFKGWIAFKNLIKKVDTEQEIQVHVDAFLYGEGEQFIATPEEVTDFTIRASKNKNYLYGHCTNVGHSDFSFVQSPI